MMGLVLLITGSSGIAEATATLAARAGHGVFLVARDEAQCRELSARLPDAGYFACDLRQESAVEESFASCIERFGRVDAAFNVAGMSGRQFGDGPIHECTLEGWSLSLDAYVKPTILRRRAGSGYGPGAT